ncbi:uncharacterized protein LOC128553892 [Mercenaria mercenaria]|uniref:uncharacterized protein LOC128553892 n=1 Tax=Mercenaria mercenaria TaxID=6596 RepID=UPI00234EEAD9|nr:uncharacterized protein LOC128553892 [Mercenaria mercenaria]
MQSWDRWLRTGTNGCQQFREEIMKLLCNVAKARSESEYEESVSILKNSEYWKENKNLSTWFQKQWLSNSRRWVSCYRRTIFNVRVSTTNGLERQHQTLKASYLSGYTDGTLTCLVTCLVTRFLPDSYKRYVEYNVKSLDMCRAYTPNLPNFLHNRPKMFVKHCAQRLPPSQEHIPMENIKKQEDEAVFTIKSIDSGSCYTVDLGGALPSCSCKDWEKFHLPCKHMLAILTQIEGYGWDSLNEDFRDCPHFCIDPDLKNSCHYDKKVAIPEPLTSNNRRNFSVKTDKRQTNQEELSINIDKNPQIKPKKTAIGSRCKGLSSSIHSLMFLIKKREDYEEIFQDLTQLYSKLKKMVPTEGGLRTRPVKFGRKDRLFKHGQLNLRKNKRNQRGHQSFIGRRQKSKKDCYKHGTNSNGEALNPQRANHSRQNCIIPQDSCMNITENLEESIRDTELEHLDTLVVGTASQTEIDEAEADGLVEKLWALDRDFDVPVAKVYGISVTDTDIRSLNGTRWLTDNVIDGFLEMLTNQENDKGTKILHILHSTMRGIVLGTYDPRNQRTMKLKVCYYVFHHTVV